MGQFVFETVLMFSERTLTELRPQLLRFCVRLLNNAEQAEDVVQEALLIALRKPETRDPAAYVFGVARMLCKNMHRQRQSVSLDEELASHDDPLAALLSRERGGVLDAAFARLDVPTRQLLVARYLDEKSVGAVAQEWGLTENAASLRLMRAREALESVLVRELPEAALVHGLISKKAAEGWQTTTIYCLRCGNHKMEGCLTQAHFALHCPECDKTWQSLAGLATTVAPLPAERVLAGASGFRVGLRRVNAWWQTYLTEGLRRGKAACVHCGAMASVRRGWPGGSPGFLSNCDTCRKPFFVATAGLLMHTNEGQQFWSEQARLRFAGQERLHFQGREAVLVRFEARGSAARLEAIYAADDLTRLK
ncbi:sigma-70 family RNA polymerase sigma factor [Armatimonas sp.]|uniref:RNA polymerase sigma factor n=1 Tax=Armatimonas sp. TaxID=1872638 RepID=UPI00286B0275|nr:sigma-70 family RNA polymerase sigma factor [Armatimonas sp.]